MARNASVFVKNQLEPFYDPGFPNGDRPVHTYNLGGGVTLFLEQTKANGCRMKIKLSNAGWNFGVAPTKLCTLGFGQGPLYTQAVDSVINDHTDPITRSAWNFYNSNWQVKDDAGYRYAEALNGGAIEFDTALSQDDQWIHFSSQTRASTGATGAEQWKSYRARELEFGGGAGQDGAHVNQIYTNQFPGVNEKARVQTPVNNPPDDQVNAVYSTVKIHPFLDDSWSLHTFTAYSGHVDQSDGLIFGANGTRGQPYIHGSYSTVGPPAWDSATGMPLISSVSTKRWRRLMVQEFLNLKTDGTFRRSDLFMQSGSPARLLVSDTSDLSVNGNRFELPIPRIDQNLEAHSFFWKAFFPTLAGKYCFYIDNQLTLDSDGVVGMFQFPGEF